MPVSQETTTFSPALVDYINQWKDKPGSLIMILHRMQEDYGYIPRPAAIALAKMIDVPLAKIYGVVTFYHLFKLKKPGKNRVNVCMGTACYLKGGEDLIQEMENLLGVGVNEVTSDGMFSIEAVRCVGCCGLAPVIMVNNEVYGKVRKDQLAEIIAKHREA